METTSVRLNTWRQALMLAGGTTLVAAFAGFFVSAAVTTPATDKRVLAIVVAVLLAAFTASLLVGAWAAMQPRAIVCDTDGVRYDSRHRPWRLRWDELVSVRLEVGYHVLARGVMLPKRLRRTYAVRLIMTPTAGKHAADTVLDRRYRGKWGATPDSWSVPFGSARELVAPLDAALRAHAGTCYTGLVDRGELPAGLL